jgi:hypothetical protein
MATNDVYMIALRALLNGRPVVNVLAFNTISSLDSTATTLGTVANFVKNQMRTQQVDDLTYTDWTATKVRGSGVTYNTSAPFRVSTVSFAGSFTGTNVGSLTGTPAAPNACAVAVLNTAQSGRRRKGHLFMGGITEALIDDNGLISGANVTILNGMFANVTNSYGPSGTDTDYRLGVWSDRIATNTVLSNTWPRVRITAGAPDPTTAWAQVENIAVRSFTGSQRDRRPGI